MLQQFFASFFIILVIFALIIIKRAIPMWQFLVRADAVIKIYDSLKEKLKMDVSIKGENKILCGKYKLKFSNTNEASIELEKLVNETLECYDRLGWIVSVDDTFKAKKDELIRICYEVKILRWQKQGI